MTNLLSHELTHRNKNYRLAINFDEQAIEDGHLKLVAHAEHKHINDTAWSTITLEVVFVPNQNIIEIFLGGDKIGTIGLNHVTNKNALDINNQDTEAELEAIEEIMGESVIEQIISACPTDPFLGCLIKGAASTAIGQVIRCWNQQQIEELTEKLNLMRECISGSGERMFYTFVFRVGRCTITAGLG